MSVSAAEEGSILMESLIAAAIIAMILAAAYQVSGDSAMRHRKVEARRYALMVASSQLAAVGAAIPLDARGAEGVDGEDAWRVDMRPCGEGASTAGTLYCVTVSVRPATGGEPLVTLSSRRLASGRRS